MTKYPTSDIDIFVHGIDDDEQANNLVRFLPTVYDVSSSSRHTSLDLPPFPPLPSPPILSVQLKHIHSTIKANTQGEGIVIRTRRTVTIINSYPYRHTQVILRSLPLPPPYNNDRHASSPEQADSPLVFLPFPNTTTRYRLYKSPAQVLLGFDVDCCTCA
jgi:hypothetical protein